MTLNGESIASVANRLPNQSGGIAGNIADQSLGNYMPHLKGQTLRNTQIAGGQISTTAVGADGKETSLNLYNAAQFEKPSTPYSTVTASDGSQWYQLASGNGASAFYQTPNFTGSSSESEQIAAVFPGIETGTSLRTVDNGVIEANSPAGNSLWYSGMHYEEPNAPHTVIQASDGVNWYAMQPNAEPPAFEHGAEAAEYNCAQFREFIPGYEREITTVDGTYSSEGHFEVRHNDGSGTMFYDTARYSVPRGDYQTYEDTGGNRWYAVYGEASVERKPVYEAGKPVYDGDSVRTVSVETVRYHTTPSRFGEPKPRENIESHPPKRR